MEQATDRYGRRRYNLRLVQAWLNEGRPKGARREDRVAVLERQVADLTGPGGRTAKGWMSGNADTSLYAHAQCRRRSSR